MVTHTSKPSTQDWSWVGDSLRYLVRTCLKIMMMMTMMIQAMGQNRGFSNFLRLLLNRVKGSEGEAAGEAERRRGLSWFHFCCDKIAPTKSKLREKVYFI